MTMDGGTGFERIERAAMTLGIDDRERRAHAMLASLPAHPADGTALKQTIGRRYEELRSGKVMGIPAEDVIRDLENLTDSSDEEEERRFQAYLAGEMEALPAEQVIAEARQRLARQRTNQREEADRLSADEPGTGLDGSSRR